MEMLDISISGRTIPKVEHPTLYAARTVPDADLATPERLAMSADSTVTEDGGRQFKDELLVRLADKGQLYPDAITNLACRNAGEKYYADWYGSGLGPAARLVQLHLSRRADGRGGRSRAGGKKLSAMGRHESSRRNRRELKGFETDQYRRTKNNKKDTRPMNISAQEIARALDGDAKGNTVLAPGPGHTKADRSLSIKLDPSAPDGFVVNSFAGNHPLDCKDYVREKLGNPWKLTAKRQNPMEQMRAAAYAPAKTGRAEYVYRQADGDPYLRVMRPGFYQSHWTGVAWANGAPKGPKIPYRLPEILAAEHGDVIVVEGEKDADNLTAAGFVATTNSCGAGKWTPDLNQYLAGKDVLLDKRNSPAASLDCKNKHSISFVIVNRHSSSIRQTRSVAS
jgi:hypothetical protein